eukprot:scpid27814/ scgid30225/ 
MKELPLKADNHQFRLLTCSNLKKEGCSSTVHSPSRKIMHFQLRTISGKRTAWADFSNNFMSPASKLPRDVLFRSSFPGTGPLSASRSLAISPGPVHQSRRRSRGTSPRLIFNKLSAHLS